MHSLFRNRAKRAFVSLGAAVALALLGAMAVFGGATELPTVKLNPLAVAVEASGSWKDEPAAWALFDRDTATAYAPAATTRVLVTLPADTDITAVKVYGSATYTLSVYDDSTGAWAKVPGLDSIDLTRRALDWGRFPATTPIKARLLMLELTRSGNLLTGIREIELWGTEPGDPGLRLGAISSATDLRSILAASPLPGHIVPVSALPAVLDVPADGNNRGLTLTVPVDARLIKRAVLLYDSYNADHLITPEKRLNNGSWTGGYAFSDIEFPDWKSHIEEINPAGLVRGENRIEFRNRLVDRQPSSYFVRDVVLVLELANGWNSVYALSGTALNPTNIAAAAFDGDLTTYYELKSTHTLEINLERTVQPEAVMLNLWAASGTPSGTITLQYSQSGQWKSFTIGGVIDMAGLRSGWNEITMPSAVTADALRLTFEVTADKKRQGATVAGVSELELVASPVGSRPSRGMVVTCPRAGEYFGRTAVIQGFVDPVPNSLAIEGKAAASADGAFSLGLTKDETRFASQKDDEAWEAKITATYTSSTLSSTVMLTKNILTGNPSRTEDSNNSAAGQREKFSEKIAPGQAKKIKYKGVTLDIPEGAVDVETEITIIPLTEADLARLNPGMINVTFPDAGYRFLPHGLKFKKPIKISFGYSKQLFAAGQTDEEVNMYFYDESLLRWVGLKKIKVEPTVPEVISETDHFTDIINSTLVVPEHPQALSFNPNSIKDIKAADPSANISLIEPPQANNKGAANLNYPIAVPPGRNGLAPQLAVQYNSSGGNGWTGVGWDVSMPSISIDTRFGAPVYDESKRIETYLLNGQQLVLAPNGEYRLRVEGQFQRIVRHGTSAGAYWWVVTDKSGTRYVYGGDASAQLRSQDGARIFTWYLSRIVDSNGNTVDYAYAPKNQAQHNGSGSITGEPATYTYVSEIRYPGHIGNGKSDDQIRYIPATTTGSYYRIRFIQDETKRPDAVVDGRPGFKTVLDERLKSIVAEAVLQTGTSRIRKYEFNYAIGDFDKTLLQSVAQYGADDTEFNRHSFEYYAMPDKDGGYDAFSPVQSWSIPAIDGGLSLTKNDDKYAGVYLGFMIYTNLLHIGAGWGWGSGKSDTQLLTLDLNGDGLSDFLERGFYYKNNWVTDNNSGSAFNSNTLEGSALNTLGKEENKVRAFDLGLHIGRHTGQGSAWKKASITRGTTTTEIQGNAIMADINGDGLVDQLAISGGTLMVRLNNGRGFDALLNWAGGVNIAPAISSAEKQALLDEYPLMDPVRAWKAPFKGIVSLSGTVSKPVASDETKGEDGVRIDIYKGLSSTNKWGKVFKIAESVDLASVAELQSLSVDRGEFIYAKVSAIQDSNNDKLDMDITVTYSSLDGQDAGIINDPRFDQTITGEPAFLSNSRNAFAMAAVVPKTLDSNPAGTWVAPYKGKIRLTNTIVKQATSEDLRFRILQINETETNGQVSRTETILLDEEVSAATVTTINDLLEDHEISADTTLVFDISAPRLGTVRADRVNWIPEVRYVHICTPTRAGVDIDDPSTFIPSDGESGSEYLNDEVCTDLTAAQQEMTDRDVPGATPPDDGTPPVKMFIFRPTPVLNVYPFKRLKPMEAWVAPRTGTVRIVTKSYKLVETPSDIHVKIQSTNQLVSQYTYQADELRQRDLPPLSTVDVQVTAGQRLFFTVVSKDAITPETVEVPDPNSSEGGTITIPSFTLGHEILYVDSPHCYAGGAGTAQTCVEVVKGFSTNGRNWTMHFDNLCLASDRCVIVDCTGIRQPGAPVALAAASCLTTEYVPNPEPGQPPVLVNKPVTQAERAATGLDRHEYFVPAVNRDTLEWTSLDRSPLMGFYRDWAYVIWNGNKTWDPALLLVPEEVDEPVDPWNPTDEELDKIQPPDFWQAKPFAFGSNRYPDISLWSGGNFDYLSADEAMPYRTGGNITPFIRVPTGAGISDLRKTKSKQTKTALGVGPLGASKNVGPSKTELDLVDMNGDRYPDQVSTSSIVFNNGTPGSGFATAATPVGMGIRGEGALRKTDSKSVSLSFGSGSLFNESNSDGEKFSMKSLLPTVGTGYGSSRTLVELIDINGDGLPDRVFRNGGSIIVRLNLGGNRFGAEENWTAPAWSVGNISRSGKLGEVSPNALRATDTVSANISSGGGSGGATSSYGGSVSLGVNGSRTIVDLTDINGDGLPDLVMKEHGKNYFLVRINQGNSFGSEMKWFVPDWGAQIGRGATATLFGGNDVLGYNEGWTVTGGLNATFEIPITFVLFTLYIFIEPDANLSTGQGASSLALMDVNGDGVPDQVYRANSSLGGAGSSEVRIKLGTVGKTNLLKTVKRPLGGAFTLDYERRGNETDHADVDMPHSQWVMTRVELSDGRGSTYRTISNYGKGYYSRAEREFYGFDRVIETQAPGTPLQRTATRTFENKDYYLRNLAQKSVTADKDGNAWARTINTYEKAAVKVMRGQGAGGSIVAGAKFPKLLQSDSYFYTGATGENSPAKSTAQKFTYDEYGNITRLVDFADEGSADNLIADIGYWGVDSDESYMTKPDSITVSGASGVFRDRSSDYEAITGNLTKLTMNIQQIGSDPAVWEMNYDARGNLDKITYPSGDPNYNTKKNARYFIQYAYDAELAMYPASITDAFGYTSEAAYHYEWGQPKWQKDINHNYQVNVYDAFGRLSKIFGPCETSGAAAPSNAVPTLGFRYIAPAIDENGVITNPAGAVTENRASACSGTVQAGGQIIRTVTFADGMQRIIQTKKDAEVASTPGMTLSGAIVFDALGRVVEQGQPDFEAGNRIAYTPQSALRNPTLFYYDTLDRTTEVLTPDAKGSVTVGSHRYAKTSTIYGFDPAPGNTFDSFKTTVIDPEGSIVSGAGNRGTKISYKDVKDHILAVVEFNKVQDPVTKVMTPVELITRYDYDALGQILTVRDTKGHTTTVTYDRLGRRTSIDNPDTGLTDYTYDPNGNVTTKKTANARSRGNVISYTYDYNRLVTIDYPESVDVAYEYGAPNETGDNNSNLAGRIKKVTDESGTHERFYGRLGEVVKEQRQPNAFNNPVARTKYETRYVFDSFGRMLEMTYPDGEVLNYIYDTGGLLKQAYGTKRGNKYWYIKNLIYDEFGQRTRIEYGNGVYTNYTYDPTTRRLSHLLTVENAKKRTIQELSYTYDLVGNIMNTNNTAPIPGGGEHGGPTDQSFTYDNLYQLVTADGAHRPGENKRTTYNNRFAYDIIGNITWKFQNHKVLHGTDSATEPRETNYELKYIYDPISKPHAVRDAGDKLYTYDPNGNMLGWTSKTSGAKRTIVWNEENRVKSIADSGSTTVFLYNDAGERVVKRGQHGESVYLNRFYSVKNGDLGSKHVFAGETRIVTKLEKDGGSLQSGVPGSIALERSQGLQNAILQGNGQKKGIERRLTNPDGTPVTGTNPPIEKFQFFYHGDHLGSSSFITDDAGAVYQHLEYFPYGETWIESGGTGQMPYYRFTGKELDPETGLYYYGARYYDPVLSRWISADPALAKYLSDNNGGVQNSKNLNLYSYVHQNPIRLVDPNGEFVFAMEYNKDKQYGTIAIVWNGFFPDWIGRINTRADDGNGIRSGIYDYTVGTHPSAGGESNRYYTDQGQAYKALNLTKNGSSELPALRQKADGTMTYTGINAHAGNRMRFSQGWIDWMLKRPDASTGSSGCITICVTKDPKKTITQNDPSTWDNYSDFISSFPEGDQSKFILTRPGEAGGWFKEKVGQAAHWLEKALAPKKQSEE